MDNGTVENEMRPVLRARTRTLPHPDPAEVEDLQRTPWHEFADLSPWCVQQVHQLRALGPDARRWPTAPETELPAAARNATTQVW